MSRGSKVVTFRVPTDLENLIWMTIHRRNSNTREHPWTLTDFIKAAVMEKVKHMERSRKRKRCKIDDNAQEPILNGGVIHHPGDDSEFWESLYTEMEKAEREAIYAES